MKKFYTNIEALCGLSVAGTTSLSTATGVTVATSDNSTNLATTAFVKAQGYATTTALSGYVPITRTITINGTTLDLSADRTWTIPSSAYTSKLQHQVKAGVAINKGQAVYVTGADGTNMIVGLASNAAEATSSKTMGLLDATVATNGFANVITEGLLDGLDTSTAGSEGDPVWLGTGGNLIYGLINKPSAPAHLVFIGIVTRKNNSNGEIFVKVQNGFELNEIHDVDLKTTVPVNGHILGFDGTLWVNKTIAGWLGYTPANASGTTNYISKFTGSTTLGNSLIYDDGSGVGIGTTSPSSKLSIVGPDNASGLGVLELVTSSTNLKLGGNFDYSWIQSHNSKPLRINELGNNVILNLGGGNVGIGTSSPAQKLDVTDGDFVVRDAADVNKVTLTRFGGIELRGNGTGYRTVGTPNTDALSLATNNTSRVYITSGGNVGIGTTSPTNKLQVANGDMSITSGYSFILADTDTNWRLGRNIISETGNQLTSNTMQFIAANASGQGWQFVDDDGGTRFEIEASTGNAWFNTGNVAIGAISALYKLDIAGAVRLTGSLVFDDTTSNLIQHRAGTDVNTLVTVGHGGFDHNGYLRIGGADVATRAWVQSQGYLTSYTETDTLASVTARGNTTTGSITVLGGMGATETTDGYGLEIMGNYTNGQYNHRLSKFDKNGGVPLYIQFTSGTANVWSNSARFGSYSGNGYEFEVYGAAKVNGDLASTGQINASGGDSSQWNTAYSWGNHASQGYATQTYVNTAIANLVDAAPTTLDTLNELAAALGDDPNFATTVATSIGTKLPLAGGTMTGKIFTVSTGTGTYDTAIEIREQGYVTTSQSAWGYSPAMTFHWGGRHAIRFGLRSDGLMAVDDAPIALRSWVQAQGYLTSESDTLNSVTGRGNTTSNSVRFGSHVDLSPTGSAFRFYDGTTFRGGLGLDDWAHGGSAANITAYVNGDNNFFISTSGVKRAQFNSGAAIFRTYSVDTAYNIRITGGDQINAYYNDAVATLYLQYHNGNGGTLNVGNGKLTVNTAGSVVASGDMRAPIFYDSNDTNYYLDLSSSSNSSYAAGVFRQNDGKYVRDSSYRTYSGYSDYYSGGNAGWYRVAEITLTANCSGAVLYGTLYDHRYDGADAYQVSIVARAECDFTSNNESHYINVGCTILGSTAFSSYQSKIRVLLVASSSNSRTYEVQFYETNWNHDTWQLETTGWTVYSSPQAPRSSTGTARVNYISNQNADYQRANAATYSPIYYDSQDTAYYVDPNATSNIAASYIGRVLINYDGTDTWFRMQSGNRMRITTTGGNDVIIPNTGNMTYNGDVMWHAGNDGSGSGLDADLLDGIDSGSFLRSDVSDSFSGTLTMGAQRALIPSNYGHGVYGIYSAERYQHVWSMGAGYDLPADGVSNGNGGSLYGLAWSYNPDYGYVGSNAQSKPGLNHQLLLMMNGVTHTALGSGIWTNGLITTVNHGTSANWKAAYDWGNHASQSYATTSYVTTQINNLINGAPGALDTLSELASALGNDASFATTVTNSIAGKVSKSGDTMTGNLTTTGLTVGNGVATGRQPYGPLANANIVLTSSASDSSGVCGIEFTSGNNYPSDGATIYFENNAAGGGSERAKLTLRVENDQEDFIELRAGKVVINANTYSGGGQNPAVIFQHNDTQIASITSGGQIDASGGNSSQWNTAYGWGNHAGLYLPISGGNATGWVSFSSSTQGTPIIKAVQQDSSSGYYLFQGVTGSSEVFRVERTGNIVTSGTLSASGYNKSNWDTAYGWGNHASAGYLTSYSETDTLATVCGRGATTTTHIYVNNSDPTLYLQDTDHRSAMIHVNSNYFYILNGSGNNSTSWAQQANSRWLFMGNLNNNDITFGGAGDFAGSLVVGGTITENSSIRYKENVVDLESATEKVEQLRAVRYNKIGHEIEEIGLIAEEVAEVYPEVVNYNEEGQPDGVNYTRLSVILLKAVQELTERINKLESK